MRIMRSRLFALCAALLVSACSADRTVSGPTPTPTQNLATLAVRLQSSRSVSGVAVSVTAGPVIRERVADSSGSVQFNELSFGSYTVTAAGSGFKPATRSVDLQQTQYDLSLTLEALPPFTVDDGPHRLVDGAGRDSYLTVKNTKIVSCSPDAPAGCFGIKTEICMDDVPDVAFHPPNGWGTSYWKIVASDGTRPTSDPVVNPHDSYGPVSVGTCTLVDSGGYLPQGATHLMFVGTYLAEIKPEEFNNNACPPPIGFHNPNLKADVCVPRYAYPISR